MPTTTLPMISASRGSSRSSSKPSKIIRAALIPAKIGGNLLTSVLERVTGKKYGRSTTSQLASTTFGKALGAATAATAAALTIAAAPAIAASQGARSAAGTAASTIGKAALTHPIQTAAAGLIGIPLIAGVISEKPELLSQLPQKAFESGQGLVGAIEEHPTAAALIGSVTGGVAAYEIGKNYFGGNDNVPDLPDPGEFIPLPAAPIANNMPAPVPGFAPVDPGSQTAQGSIPAIAPLPEGIQAQGTKADGRKHKRKRQEARRQTISQRVDVRVNSIQGNKKYIRMNQYQ